jgi:putative DNA modification/repair radical SAM protein
MNIEQKLCILGESARYDVSCSSSGSDRSNDKTGGIGSSCASGICHTWTEDGRCVSLLKVLLTNHCEYDCLFCANRRSNDHTRAIFEADELADLTMAFYRRNMIEGLFLSSGVWRSPDQTMERLIETLGLLRNRHRFQGYIHAKIIPGASAELIIKLGQLADRVSINVEQCTAEGLKILAPQKSVKAIADPMGILRDGNAEYNCDITRYKNVKPFAPAGQSTQMIVGASPEKDYQILSMSQQLYKNYRLKRVYYSAYIPVNNNPLLPAIWQPPPLQREHRLYQADWLMRFYKFDAGELVSRQSPDLDLEVDPKCQWALNNLDFFPVEINQADYFQLLRVPGIGVTSARRILAARKCHSLQPEDLKKSGIVLKRAAWFITCNGKYPAPFLPQAGQLKYLLADKAGKRHQNAKQIRIEEIEHVYPH